MSWITIRKESTKFNEKTGQIEKIIEEKSQGRDWLDIIIKIFGIVAIAIPVWLFYQQNQIEIQQKRKEKLSDIYQGFLKDYKLIHDSTLVGDSSKTALDNIVNRYNIELETVGDTNLIFAYNLFLQEFKFSVEAFIAVDSLQRLAHLLNINKNPRTMLLPVPIVFKLESYAQALRDFPDLVNDFIPQFPTLDSSIAILIRNNIDSSKQIIDSIYSDGVVSPDRLDAFIHYEQSAGYQNFKFGKVLNEHNKGFQSQVTKYFREN